MANIGVIKPVEVMLEIKHPGTEQPLGIIVSLVSLKDDKLKKLRRKLEDDAINLRKRGKEFNAKEREQNKNEVCFTAMTGWAWQRPLIEPEHKSDDGEIIAAVYGEQPSFNGDESPPFDRATVMQVFEQIDWFRDQIEEKVDETKSFFTS